MAVSAPENTTLRRSRKWQRYGELKTRRAQWFARCQEASDIILPFSGRYFVQDRDRQARTFNPIYDSTGTMAARIHAAGMLAGASSPARVWFRAKTQDDRDKSHRNREWLDLLALTTHQMFHEANIYRALHMSYEEQGVFGGSAAIMRSHPKRRIHMHMLTAGEYVLASDEFDDVCTIYREYEMSVAQVVREFGIDKVTEATRRMHQNGQLETGVTVIHAIEPRADRDPSKFDSMNMEWESCYFEHGSTHDEYLREGGFERFPVLAPRWAVRPGDVYGYSPGMEALADIRGLQSKQLLTAKAIENQGDPSIQVPTSLRERDLDILPGGLSYYDQVTPHGGIRTAYEVPLRLDFMQLNIQDTRELIKDAFYVNLFLMLANSVQDTKTATEAAQLVEEKWFVLGPIIARQHTEQLKPLVEFGFDAVIASGKMPPPPPDLAGQELEIEFVSMLAQAQHAMTTSSVDRWLGFTTALAQSKPEVLDVVEADRMVRDYGEMIGVPTDMMVDPIKVAELREARNAANAAKEQSALMEQQAATTQKLAASPTGSAEPNVLTDLMNRTSGYSSPSALDVEAG